MMCVSLPCALPAMRISTMACHMKRWIVFSAAVLVAGCSVQPNKDHVHDADKEFSSLEAPDVGSVQDSMEHSALAGLKNAEYTRSALLYQQLYDKNNNETRYQLGLAESLRRLGKYEEAITYYDKILNQHPGHVDAFEGKALATMARGDIEEASKMFEQIIQRDPSHWRSYNALGIMFAVKNMLPEAMTYFNEALKYSAENPSVHNNVGLLLAMQKQYEQSVDALTRASRKAEGNQRKQIDLNLALVHGIFGHMDEAKRIAEQHLDAASLENNLGLYAHLADDDELAKSYLNMALAGSTVYYDRAWKNLDIISNRDISKKAMSPNQKSVRIGTTTTVDPVITNGLTPLPENMPADAAPAPQAPQTAMPSR